ncbi:MULTISPECIES: TetR/AcrR family transcriptional regulator [unclassified Chitinophaga]|uniref:TetR/AcrR family transcriptional regulator n=1 Tax=unclassified Chitinophaga TaxID=2619133 RepID=UPI0009CC0E74|nr:MULTISPECIES: TetR/AcrR family transcriptional regulator [unclassified Chitinophaga]OMP77521.1 TetR family transcriptional regulator [[Flexibacter] sp. ATCC 35208]WPV65311.1 TetR/AcrR family transcriptional regulator [Chitinophaga sp. LS1]
MRGRPTIYDNREALTKAQQVFWNKGYTATSLPDILAAIGIGAGSFYNAYKGGKKELFSKAIQQRREAFTAFKAELEVAPVPLNLIKDFFRSIAAADQETHMQGCIIVNTVVEMANLDEELESEAVTILKEVEVMFTETIAAAQKNGTIKNQTDATILGRYLITLWNGINVTRRMYPDNTILAKQIDMQLEILN